MAHRQSQLLIVGSGISALMSAYHAVQQGYRVELLSKSSDPRCNLATAFESATWDGGANRYITLTEGHPYLHLPGYIDAVYPSIAQDFLTPVSAGGMLSVPLQHIQHTDGLANQFLQARAEANQDSLSIQRLFGEYLDENRAALQQWYVLLQQILTVDPRLIDRLSLHWQGIDRFYDDRALYESALSSQQQQQIVKACYSIDQISTEADFSIYRSGLHLDRPFIAGGAITIYGLAFDIKALGCWLLDWLESQGVSIYLGADYEVQAIEKDELGQIVGLRTRSGQFWQTHHFLLHPGAYVAPSVLADTPAYGQLAGVKGLWLRIKQAQHHLKGASSSPRPNKIHGGKYPIELNGQTYLAQTADLNVMPLVHPDGSWDLIIGSGYLFVGFYPFSVSEQSAHSEMLVLQSFVRVIEQVYDLQIDLEQVFAGQHPWIDLPSGGCVRSWTPNDRELRVILPTASGGVGLIDGGGNTGSTTKAPFVSQVAIEFLESVQQGDRASLPDLQWRYEAIRDRHRRSAIDLPVLQWQQLEAELGQTVENARSSFHSF